MNKRTYNAVAHKVSQAAARYVRKGRPLRQLVQFKDLADLNDTKNTLEKVAEQFSKRMPFELADFPRIQQALFFAMAAADVDVSLSTLVQFERLPQSGYGSWLMKTGPEKTSLGVAFNIKEIKQWAGGGHDFRGAAVSDQLSRLIIHEAAHVCVSPRMLKARPDRNGFLPAASEEDEEHAWLFTMMVFSLALADYALWCRQADDCDNTSSLPV